MVAKIARRDDFTTIYYMSANRKGHIPVHLSYESSSNDHLFTRYGTLAKSAILG